VAAIEDRGEQDSFIDDLVEEAGDFLVANVEDFAARVGRDEGLIQVERVVGKGVLPLRAVSCVVENDRVTATRFVQ